MTTKYVVVATMLVGMALPFMAPLQASALQGTELITESVKNTRDVIRQRAEEAAKLRQEELESKKAELQSKLEQQKASVSEKLTGERMKRCLDKEADINRLVDSKHDIAVKHFEQFKAVQTKLTAYVDEGLLQVENGAALRVIMDDKQVIAESMVNALGGFEFSCEGTSNDQPGSILKQQVTGTKQVLRQYRDAVKQYADAVKQAVVANESGQ